MPKRKPASTGRNSRDKTSSQAKKRAKARKPAKSRKRPAAAPRSKAKPIPARWQDRSDEDWEHWGNNLGKRLEKQFDQFGKEVEQHGRRIEKHGKRFEKSAKTWWYNTLGIFGPLIESLVGIAVIGIVALVINAANIVIASVFIRAIASFMLEYIPAFLVIFLFFNYLKYLYYIMPKMRPLLRPLEAATGVTVFFWVLAWVLLMAHQSAEIGIFQRASNWIFPNLWNLFFLVFALAYLGAIVVHSKSRISDDGGNEWLKERKK